MTNRRRTLLALFAIAFGLRILYAVLLGTQPEINPHPITHSVTYAREISQGFDWIKEPYSPKAPGYPVILAGAFALSGHSLWAGIILQAIFGALTIIVVFHLGEKLGGWPTGLIAAIWFCFSIHHLHFASLLQRSILESLLLVLLLYILSRSFRRMRIAIVAGLVYSALVYVNPQYLLLFPLVAVLMLVRATKHTLLNMQYFFLFTSCFLVLLLPWTIRNYIVYKQPIPVALEATRYIRPFTGSFTDSELFSIKNPELLTHHSLSHRFKTNSIEFWRVTRFGSGQTQDDAFKIHAKKRASWSLRHNVSSIVTFGLLLPFFILGMIFSIREKNRVGWILTVTILYYFLIRMAFGGSMKTRLPIEPLITLLAFYAILRIINSLRKSSA
jgi:4-amino-4-deoxy-L-arabinose transferase-like glycosyltransferase